jgi:sugar lactone lactonase YvrE
MMRHVVSRGVVRAYAALIAIALFAGCGGTHAAAPPTIPGTGATAAPAKTTTATLRVVIPKAGAASASTRRSPKYISPATQSIAVTFTPTGGGTPLTFNQNLTTAANPSCTASLVSSLICQVTFALPAGSYVAAFATYDGLLSGTTPTGNVLSANQTMPVTLVIGQANAINVTLNGIPASVVVVPQPAPQLTVTGTNAFTLTSCFPSQTVTVLGLDVDGNVIVGPGAPVASVVSGDSSVTVGPVTVASPNTFTFVRNVAYDNIIASRNRRPRGLTAPVGLVATLTPDPSTLAPPVSVPIALSFTPTNDDNCGIIYAFAGSPTGAAGFADNPVSSALFNQPAGVAIGPSDLVYVADTFNNRIRQIAGGAVNTFAGTGAPGSDNESGGFAYAASFALPVGIAVSPGGVVYVAEFGNNDIRAIASGNVTTYAGVASSTGGFLDGPAASAQFSAPSGLALDLAGNLYVADSFNNAIRMITPGGTVSTIVGAARVAGYRDGPTATAFFNQPSGVAVDASGTIYVADTNNHRIRKIANGIVTTLAGTGVSGYADGPGATAQFAQPAGIAIGPNNTLYVSEAAGNRIRVVSASGYTTILAGSAAGTSGITNAATTAATLNGPNSIAFDSQGVMYIAETRNNDIRTSGVPAQTPAPTATPVPALVVSPANVTTSFIPSNVGCNGGTGPDTTASCAGDTTIAISGGTPPYGLTQPPGSCPTSNGALYFLTSTSLQYIPTQNSTAYGGTSECVAVVTDSSTPTAQTVQITIFE